MKTESVTRIISITFILLSLSCHSSQDGNTREQDVLHCGPQNLALTSSNQMILATWEDDPSCSAVNDELIYELLVLVGDEQVHHDLVTVTPDQIGSSHLWRWTSHVALECVSHLVRLSVRFKNYTSPRTQEWTLPGKEHDSKDPEVYPRDRIFEVGSRATFCCVLPAGGSYNNMYVRDYSNSDVNIRPINNQTYLLTVVLNQISTTSCTEVICQATIQNDQRDNGACAFIGYPPGDKDLQCKTRDLESVECHWTVGRNTHLHNSPTQYQLVGSACESGSQGKCSQKVNVSAGERNWTLTARNELGTVELWDTADLMNRVHMFAPESVTASTVNARNVSLQWIWKVQRYERLNVTCQVNVSHAGTHELTQNSGVGLDSADLMNLIPNWSYNVTVRCRTTQHSHNWSDWSSTFHFHTERDVPDAPDVWMKVKDNEILIIWKIPQENQSHGLMLDYTVTWSKIRETDQLNTTTVTHNNVTLSLDTTQQYVVKVTARNEIGSSSPSTIITPHVSGGLHNTAKTSRIIGSGGGFGLSWSSSPAASCGYIVDWCPTSGHSMVDWLRVHQTNVTIFSKNVHSGQRYSLSISACTPGAPLLLETREGYVSEKWIQDNLFKNRTVKQRGSNVEVSWAPISLTEQTAFIQGYVMYYSDRDKNNGTVSTDDPTSTSLTTLDLKAGSYEFTLKARTALGECGSTPPFSVTIDLQTDNLIKTVIISLATVFSLLLLVTVVCYRHWACIKQKVYPPIPRPLLNDTSLKSTGEHRCRLQVDLCHSEVDIMDAPQLLFKPGAQVKGLPSSPFRGVFSNLSYNLGMETENQQPQDGHTNEYQAQTLNQADEEPESPMTCVLTYVLLPQPTCNELMNLNM